MLSTIKYEGEPLLTSVGSEIYVTRSRRHRYPHIWALYEKMLASYWVPAEICMDADIKDWKNKLNKSERKFYCLIFAFFTFGDGMVIENIVQNFMNEVQDQDAKFVYASQAFYETIHATTYAMILDTLVRKEKKLDYLENLFRTDDSFIELKQWLENYMDPARYSFAIRILAFGCFEGVIFSGAFCAIFWLKKKGLMPGLTFSNELISRDEGMHSDYACMLFNLLQNVPNYDDVIEVITSSVKVGSVFMTRVAPCNLLGINSTLMIQYLEFVANNFFYGLKAYRNRDKPFPKSTNPFDWMILSSLEGKTNFFERRVGEYSNAAMVSSMNSNNNRTKRVDGTTDDIICDDNVFNLDADF